MPISPDQRETCRALYNSAALQAVRQATMRHRSGYWFNSAGGLSLNWAVSSTIRRFTPSSDADDVKPRRLPGLGTPVHWRLPPLHWHLLPGKNRRRDFRRLYLTAEQMNQYEALSPAQPVDFDAEDFRPQLARDQGKNPLRHGVQKQHGSLYLAPGRFA